MYCPSGQMDKASVSGAEDCGFESHLGWYQDSFVKVLCADPVAFSQIVKYTPVA